MRLIDIDKVVSDYKGKNKSLQNVTWIELTDYEVKAIPIEWIKKWQANHTIDGTTRNLVIFGLMHDWEKENDSK